MSQNRSTKVHSEKEKRGASSVTDLVHIAVMTSLIAVCSFITIPMPLGVPVTLQTFALFFALEFAGGKCATVAFLLYTFIGSLGVPVFAGFASGFGYLLGPTGGFLTGFVVSCMIFWFFEGRIDKGTLAHYLIIALSMASCYLCGVLWFVYSGGGVSFVTALAACVAPFVLPDAVKIVLAVVIARRLSGIIKI